LSYSEELHQLLENWIVRFTPILKDLVIGLHPKDLIERMAEDILLTFSDKKLIDRYDVFQHLMNYWADSLQDDVYIIATDGWTANPDLIPEYLMVERFFQIEKKKNESLETERDETLRHLDELLEEHTTEDGFFEPFKNDKGIINKKDLEKRAKDLKKETSKPLFKAEDNADLINELLVLEQYNTFILKDIETKKLLKIAQIDLQHKIKQKYLDLTETEIKTLVVDDKWMKTLCGTMQTEMDRISQRLTQRLKELSELYVKPLPELNTEVLALEKRVMEHLKKMGFE
jgi:type I restriction enzyme M protein